MKDELLAPAETMIGEATVKLALLLDTATEIPPPGAATSRVTVQVEVPAPVRDAEEQVNPLIRGGATVKLTAAVVEAPLAVAVIETTVATETVPAVALKVAAVLPAAMVTDAGTVSTALLSERETSWPAVGAGLFRVTAQVVAAADEIVAGEQLSVEGTTGAPRLSEALAVVPLRLAVITAVLSVVTPDTEAAKLAVEAPAATVTEAGVVTNELLSESATTAPAVGAETFSVTVQMLLPFPVTEVGLQVTEDTPTGRDVGTVTTPPLAAVAMLSPSSEEAPAFEI